MGKTKDLSPEQRVMVDEYRRCRNKTEAYKIAFDDWDLRLKPENVSKAAYAAFTPLVMAEIKRLDKIDEDALMEAAGTYEELMGESLPETDEDPVCEYNFLGRLAFGFEFPTEDGLACNFICAAIDQPSDKAARCKLFTILTTAQSYEDIDDLLDLIEENISLQ